MSRDVAATLRALANSGIDIECGSCMEIAFTGLTTHEHTCERPVPQLLSKQQIEGLRQYVAWHGPAHVEGCPADDTCFCSCAPWNDAVNSILAKGTP